jgi:hypothetical protein
VSPLQVVPKKGGMTVVKKEVCMLEKCSSTMFMLKMSYLLHMGAKHIA